MDPLVMLLCKFIASMTGLAVVGNAVEKTKGGNLTAQNQYIEDAVSLLIQLGYSESDALIKVQMVVEREPNASLERIVNEAIRL